ncbi:MAG: hypothetical protein OSA04_05275 [Flavobacteriales bacterium]|nr:hypothetical protein [Flavobacteriales bacterium]
MISRLLLTVTLAYTSLSAIGQTGTFVYPTTHMRWDEIVCHIDGGVVRLGNDWRGDIAYTVERNKIYSGYSTSSFNLSYTFREGKFYIGDSYFTDAITYTLDGKYIYVGDSTFPLDLAYSIAQDRNNPGILNIFKEDSISPFDIVAVMQGDPSPAEVFAILLTMGLL